MKLATGVRARDLALLLDLSCVVLCIVGCALTILASGNPQARPLPPSPASPYVHASDAHYLHHPRLGPPAERPLHRPLLARRAHPHPNPHPNPNPNPNQNALFIGLFSLVALTSLPCAAKFYTTLRVTRFVAATLALSLLLLALLLALYAAIGSAKLAEVALAVLAYPTLLMLVTTLLIWRASYWEPSRLVGAMP